MSTRREKQASKWSLGIIITATVKGTKEAPTEGPGRFLSLDDASIESERLSGHHPGNGSGRLVEEKNKEIPSRGSHLRKGTEVSDMP